jgi:hypothetical protein
MRVAARYIVAMRSKSPLTIVPLLAACTTQTVEPTEPPLDPEACEVAVESDIASVSEGGRARIALTLAAEVDDLTAVTSSGEAHIDEGTLVAKPAYGLGGSTMTISLEYALSVMSRVFSRSAR